MNLLKIFRRSRARKYDFLYTTISKTGLVVFSGGVHPDTFKGKAVIAESAGVLDQLDDSSWQEYMLAHLPLVIHNSIHADDFPVDDRLDTVMQSTENALRRKIDMPWVSLAYEAGNRGHVVDPESMAREFDEVTQIAFQSSRPAYDSLMKQISTDLMAWCRRNRSVLDLWHRKHAERF